MFVPFVLSRQFEPLLTCVAGGSPVPIAAASPERRPAVARSGCPHYRKNPICRPTPREPVLSPDSRTWADADFQSGRDRLPSFNANTGIDALAPFEQSQDGSDPPVGRVSADSRTVRFCASGDCR